MTLYRSYAKINLSLEVLGRREDGYHELASVAHTISLADDLTIEAAEQILTRVEGLEPLPDENLVTQAARLLASTLHTRAGAQLTLVKRIPTAAGLGGGSSDAATTLVGLNALWGKRLGYKALAKLALQLGSDVPFFLRGGAALMSGRGERLQPLPSLPQQWLVVVVPSATLPNKTAALYSALQASDFSSGELTQRLAHRLREQQPIEVQALVNAFERPARAAFADLGRAWALAEERCGRRFCLSGAGPAFFCLAVDRLEARRLVRSLASVGLEAHAARTVKHARATAKFSTRASIEYA